MKKCVILFISLMLAGNLFSQKTSFPPYSNFAELEDLVTNQLNGLSEKDIFEPLSKTDLQKMMDITTRVENIINLGGWAGIYLGYLKRAEARILFSTANIMSNQPDFYKNKNLLETALGNINRGFQYLSQYSSSEYPPYVEVNTTYTHDSQGRSTGSTSQRMSVKVNTDEATLLRSQIYEYLGTGDKALDDYYTMVNSNYTLSPYDESKVDDAYAVANHLIELAIRMKKYDQRFVNFCVRMLHDNKLSSDDYQKRTANWKLQWNKLELLINNSLDAVIADNPGSQYNIYIGDDVDRLKTTSFDWLILLVNKFDTNNKFAPFEEVSGKQVLANRVIFNLVHYCANIVEGSATPEVTTAANTILQKHFTQMADVAILWTKSPSLHTCPEIKWVSDRMDKYPIDEKKKKDVQKSMKKCHKYFDYDKYFK
jgi:hypothetical protein